MVGQTVFLNRFSFFAPKNAIYYSLQNEQTKGFHILFIILFLTEYVKQTQFFCEVIFVKKLNIAKAFAWVGLISFIGFVLLYIKNDTVFACNFLLLISIICGIAYETLKPPKDSENENSLLLSDIEEITSMPLDFVDQETKLWEYNVCDSFTKELLEKNLRYKELKKRQLHLTHPEIVDPHVFPTPDTTLDNDNKRL